MPEGLDKYKEKSAREIETGKNTIEVGGKLFELPPEGWMTSRAVRNKVKEKSSRAGRLIAQISYNYKSSNPEWFKNFFVPAANKVAEHLSPELIQIIEAGFAQKAAKAAEAEMIKKEKQKEKALERKRKQMEAKVSRESESQYQGWEMPVRLARKFGLKKEEIVAAAEKYRQGHPEWFKTIRYGTEHYASGLIEIIKEELGCLPPPPGWRTPSRVYKDLKAGDYEHLLEIAEQHKKQHPEWFKFCKPENGPRREYYSPELTDVINSVIVAERKRLDQYEYAPEGWMTQGGYTAVTGLDSRILIKKLEPYRQSNPEWFKVYAVRGPRTRRGPIWEYLAPQLIETLTQQLEEEGYKLSRRQRQLETELGQTLANETEHFKQMVGIFGAAQAVDILYINHPQYKSIPVGRVRSIIADYLGEFLVIRYRYSLEDLEKGSKYLGDQTLRDGLFEVVKGACLSYYHQEKKADPGRNDSDIIRAYVAKTKIETAGFTTAELVGLLDQVETYYISLFEDFPKPDHIVDFVKEGREFPDANQLVNIKEIQEKKKMLIADEMGLGKSASVIMAKEYLGLGQALVVVPSNVIDTWRNYLSDKVDDEGRQVGYFKKGQAPKVLVVEGVGDLKNEEIDSYDYILVSQEKLNGVYTKELSALEFDMLIVDEVHKLKNLSEGERAQNIITLAQNIEGKDKYLALLSGTPVPNKVEDVAMILKLLYPEKFEDMDNVLLVRSIIYGDLVDLRTLLVPRMQMKALEENVEMPQLQSEKIESDLSDIERDVYEVLLEEDEMTAPQKIRVMRQFLLNPELLDSTPGIEGTKIKQLREALREEFKTKDKIVLFVNGYIEGVIRGDNNIFAQLDLPDDVEIMVIEGEISKARRIEIQAELKQSKKKILLAVSGQTADVGVDFTGGEAVYFYNEPWTKYDKLQQLSRVYRPGLQTDLISRTLITRDTIEEGINQYIEAKHRSIEKLLRGIPLTDLERSLLEESEKQPDPNLEVNAELADYYFTAWDRMMKIFSEVKEIGEQNFIEYTNQYGREYADCYLDLGSRSYQANGSRLVGAVIDQLVKNGRQNPQDIKILDIASGPEMLKKHTPERLQGSIFSLDINKHHFAQPGENRIIGRFGSLPIQSGSLDYANLSLALHYTKYLPRHGEFERMEVLLEMNRVLKEGGKAVVNLIYSLDLKDEEQFRNLVSRLGFKVLEEYTGEVSVGSGYKSHVITLEKVNDVKESVGDIVEKTDKETLEGLKLSHTKSSVRDTKKFFKQFTLAGKIYNIEFNAEDSEIYQEEQKVLEAGRLMKKEYGAVEKIPRDIILEFNFVRFFDGKRYILFRKLEKGRGIVVIK